MGMFGRVLPWFPNNRKLTANSKGLTDILSQYLKGSMTGICVVLQPFLLIQEDIIKQVKQSKAEVLETRGHF